MESVYDDELGRITFETRRTTAGSGPRKWEALIHQRDCVWTGETEAEAIGKMLNGVARMSFSWSVDPSCPEEPGPVNNDPVQQCIELLHRKLAQLVTESADSAKRLAETERPFKKETDRPYRETRRIVESRRSFQETRRVIGNVGTALAALCRIEG